MEILKTFISFLLGTVGAWMMWRGKKIMNTRMIVWGGVLIVLSYWMFSFSWGGGKEMTAEDIKKLMPKTSDQPQIP